MIKNFGPEFARFEFGQSWKVESALQNDIQLKFALLRRLDKLTVDELAAIVANFPKSLY